MSFRRSLNEMNGDREIHLTFMDFSTSCRNDSEVDFSTSCRNDSEVDFSTSCRNDWEMDFSTSCRNDGEWISPLRVEMMGKIEIKKKPPTLHGMGGLQFAGRRGECADYGITTTLCVLAPFLTK